MSDQLRNRDSRLADAIRLARELVAKVCGRGRPVDVAGVARSLGVTSIEARDMAPDGFIVTNPSGGLSIRYRADAGPERARFTIAHEIAHILLDDVSTQTPGHAYRTATTNCTGSDESFANRIAAEVLMPSEGFADDLSRTPVDLASLRSLRSRYAVSFTSIAFRIVETKSLAAIFIRAFKGDDGVLRTTCRVSDPDRISLVTPPQELAGQLWLNSGRNSNLRRVTLSVADYQFGLPVLSLPPDRSHRSGCILGWARMPDVLAPHTKGHSPIVRERTQFGTPIRGIPIRPPATPVLL